jgi:siroheme synthase-like protein
MKYADRNMMFLPISLNISNKEILVIEGGKVACHKIKLLLPYSKNIRVVAISVCEEIRNLKIPYTEKEYHHTDLKDAFLVYACTDIKELNQRVYDDAHNLRILVNVVDNSPMCDFVSPAIYKKDHMAIAVGSNAQDVYVSIKWRDAIKDYLEENPVSNK